MRKVIIGLIVCIALSMIGCEENNLTYIKTEGEIKISKQDNTEFTDKELEELFEDVNFENSAVSVDGKTVYVYTNQESNN